METTRPSQPSGDSASFHMIDVGGKPETQRRAIAQGKAFLAPDAYRALRDKTNPKGDVLALAEVAGILAAKRTSDLIPLCHPLPLQSVRLAFVLSEAERAVTVTCEASTLARTGVEMEALSGVNGALLTIYDLSKAVNPAITLGEIRLNVKEGGKSGLWTHPDHANVPGVSASADHTRTQLLPGLRAAVITISDRATRVGTPSEYDSSGPAIRSRLEAWGADLADPSAVPDEKAKIQDAIRYAIHEQGARLVITTGGTGLSPRDVTPEAITEIADRLIPGIGECLRSSGAQHVNAAWLSRSLAAQVGPALVVALPGSRKAVLEGLEALEPILTHALHVIRGGDHA